MRIRGLLQVAALGVAVCAPAVASADEVFTLDNGLRVTLRSVPKAEQTAVVVLFDVGGDHDPAGQSGLAHLIEHCYVTAAAGDTPARTVEAMGTRYKTWNAQTGNGYTVVAFVVPGADAEAELREQAARMGALKVTAADLQRELPRLTTELANMYERNPVLAARNHARARIHPGPEGHRHGGVVAQVEALTAEQVQARWSSLYKPANARLLVMGANAEGLKKAVEDAFGALPAGEKAAEPAALRAPKLGETETVAIASDLPNAKPIACLAVPAVPGNQRLYGAWCVALSRLWMKQARQKKGPGRVKIVHAPLDDPVALYGFTEVGAGETGAGACNRIAKFIADSASQPVAGFDRAFCKKQFAPLLGTGNVPRPELPNQLYASAFGLGRMAQLGMTSAQTTKRINGTTTPVLAEMVKGFLARERQARIIVSLKN
ncbi:MAG: M16 family metallopeptidase [Planctomycetota bacterium]|jgi:zinc protease